MPKNWTHILLIEDDPIYGEFVKTSILDAHLPVTVGHVTTLDAALAYLRGEPPFNDRIANPMPSIVLLDINLAHQNAFPVLRFLGEHGHLENKSIRVIMLTSSDRQEDFREALKLGAVSFLIK